MCETSRGVKISVRNLVEFILRSGDLDNTKRRNEVEAMQEGSRMHRKIQKRMGSNYAAEVPLSMMTPIKRDNILLELTVEGRADGILYNDNEEITIDEIKGVYLDLEYLTKPIEVHPSTSHVLCLYLCIAEGIREHRDSFDLL